MTRSLFLRAVLPLLLWCAISTTGIAAAAPEAGLPITIVLSGPSPHYAQTAEILEAEIRRKGLSAKRVALAELQGKGKLAPTDERALYVAIGTGAARWLGEHAPPSTPIVYCLVTGLDDSALVERPWTAGVRAEVAPADQLRLIREVLPQARHVGLLYHGDGHGPPERIREKLPEGWKLHAVDVSQHGAFAKALDALMQEPIDVLWTMPDRRVMTKENTVHSLTESLRRRMPVFGFSHPCVRSGALIGVGISPGTQARQAARLLEAMIVAPADAPRPPQHVDPEFEISVNLEVARQLDVSLPEALVDRVAHRYGD